MPPSVEMSSPTSVSKPDMKVIGLGLGRTGTLSMRIALEKLGFGPCYHMKTVIETRGRDIPYWTNVENGINPTENLYKIFQGYHSGTDYPQAKFPQELLEAFPDAKFILSVRPFPKWKTSVENTILQISDRLWLVKYFDPLLYTFATWIHRMLFGPDHFDGDFHKNAENVWFSHIEKVKRVIPEDQLLIYEVGEGWEKLCKFLDVPIPSEPYPRANDTVEFHRNVQNEGILPWYLVPLFMLSNLRYFIPHLWGAGHEATKKAA